MTTQYFAEEPGSPEHRREITVDIWGRTWTLTTANGVFAGEGLDRGTAVLLRKSPIPVDARRVLDLGCGYGSIALAIAQHVPDAVIDAVDVNGRALALCRDNAEALGVADRVRVLRPEEADREARYDEIWSNPPIRIGKPALHELLSTWLPRLAPDGVARLVVSKNLGADTLQRWLVEQGYACLRAATDKGFRVLVVRRGLQQR
jgi:16S rRNA (guanine1207-N2)-methyltransferase